MQINAFSGWMHAILLSNPTHTFAAPWRSASPNKWATSSSLNEKQQARGELRKAPGLELLGPADATRLPIFLLWFKSGTGELHHGFVMRLVNALFGIQARGGCSCAGPLGRSLLDLTPEYSEALAAEVRRGFGC